MTGLGALGLSAYLTLLPHPLKSERSVTPPSYERYISPQITSPKARALRQVVHAWALTHGQVLRYDWRLDKAAQTMLLWAEGHTGDPLPLQNMKNMAWQAGWTDGEIMALAMTSQEHVVANALALELATSLGAQEATHMGLAYGADVGPTGQTPVRATVVVALSRRLIQLNPVPTTRLVQSQLNLVGTLYAKHIRALTVAALHPDGQVTRTPLWIDHKHFMGAIEVGQTPGPLNVEILAERGRGPEVAASFVVHVQTGDAQNAPSEALQQSPQALSAHGQTLSALVWGIRQSHHLALPMPHAILMRAAQAHAEDMVKHHFFAHVSARTGDVTHRLTALGQPYVHVVENIALDQTLGDAFGQWLTSPGHLQNILDPRVGHLGVGVAQTTDVSPPQTMAVVVMAQLPDPALP
jgi:uncharacterized protein YkwD